MDYLLTRGRGIRFQRVICETDSLEVFHLLQDSNHSQMHVFASLLVKIFGLKEHIPNISFQHVLREGNHCTNFLAKLGHSSRLGVTFWQSPPSKLKSVLRLDAQNWALFWVFFYFFFFFFCHSTKIIPDNFKCWRLNSQTNPNLFSVVCAY